MTPDQEWLYRELRAVIEPHLADISDEMDERLMNVVEDVFEQNPDATEVIAADGDDADDGTNGQDRESYTDDQDRDSYSVD